MLLASWANYYWHDVNGRCLLRGIDLPSIELSDCLDVIHALLVDEAEASALGRLRPEARKVVENWLAGMEVSQYDRETWGRLPEHQEGLRAAMSMM